MPTRRGYDPVDDEDLRQENNESLRSGYSAIPSEGVVERAAEDPGEAPQAPDDTPETPQPTQNDAAGPGSMRVRILDVQGQIYSISVTPEMTVRELKTMLVEVAGVEISRQRIIYGGKILGDSDTLASRKISDGVAVHLFQRPKASEYTVVSEESTSGARTASTQQAGNLSDIPPLLLQFQDRGLSRPTLEGEGFVDAHWEVEEPRRGIRFLASFLLLVSIMQVQMALLMESMAAYSAASTSKREEGHDDQPELSSAYWTLLDTRFMSSILGIVVGLLGIRGSQSLESTTLRLYYIGVILCALVAVAIRIEVLFDVIAAKIPYEDYPNSYMTSSSYDADDGEMSSCDEGGSGCGVEHDHGGGGGQGSAGSLPTDEDRGRYIFSIFVTFTMVVVSGGVWLLCVYRAGTMRGEIEAYNRRRGQQLGDSRVEQDQEVERDAGGYTEEGEATTGADTTPAPVVQAV